MLLGSPPTPVAPLAATLSLLVAADFVLQDGPCHHAKTRQGQGHSKHWLTRSCAQARAATNAAASTSDDWELDPSEIAFHDKIASGAFGDLYRGVYCGQDVAIKILRNVQTNSQQFAEFQQVPSPPMPCL